MHALMLKTILAKQGFKKLFFTPLCAASKLLFMLCSSSYFQLEEFVRNFDA